MEVILILSVLRPCGLMFFSLRMALWPFATGLNVICLFPTAPSPFQHWYSPTSKARKCQSLAREKIQIVSLRNPGRDISFPIFIRKEIETRKLERKSKQ